MKKKLCGDTIETGQLQFTCTRIYPHKGKHRTSWRARNLGADPRMITVTWVNQNKEIMLEG
jgi:hypothetical protein